MTAISLVGIIGCFDDAVGHTHTHNPWNTIWLISQIHSKLITGNMLFLLIKSCNDFIKRDVVAL